MKFKVLTQVGKTYTDDVDYVILRNEDGEMGILNNHIPIIVQMREGYIKFVQGKNESFLVVEQGVIEFKDNELTILALETQMGQTLEKAKAAFNLMKKEKMEFAKKENVDFSKQERELRENIMKSKAGQV